MRCAVYARFSSDRQKATSIDDQVRKCRQHAKIKGWEILDDFIFTDEAISGSRSDRDGFNKMLKAAERTPRSFDCLLVDDTSRFARDLPYALTKTELLDFYGIEIHFVAQGINSKSEQFRTLMTINGMVDEQYSVALGQKTKRGLEGTAERGNHTGGRCFGYRNIPIESKNQTDAYGRATIVGAKLEVDPDQAETVRRIFQMYVDGHSLKTIAKMLNADKVASPQPALGRIQQSWCPSSIRVMLHNERYRGVVIFGKTRKLKDPRTKKRVQRANVEADMIRKEFPEQRIVSDGLWNKVQDRIKQVKEIYGERGRKGGLTRARALHSPYLFSGLMKCGECGGNLVIVSGKGRNHTEAHYGCAMNAFRNTCSNSLRIRKDVLENQLLEKLQTEVLQEDAIEYALSRFEEELTKGVRNVGSQMSRLEQRKRKLERELHHLGKAIASGLDSQTLRAGIAEREAEITDIHSQIICAKPDTVRTKIRDARKFVESSLKDIRKLLNSDPATAKATLSRHMPSIVLSPEPNRRYQVVSQWELLPGSAISAGYTSGAEGQS
ncbi:MAG: recombinase family protein [Candidatus Acidiferrales bacterium]